MVLLIMSLWKQNKLPLRLVLVGEWIPLWRDPIVKGPPLHCDIALDEAKSWVDAYTSSVSSWLTPNDSWLSLSLLEEVTVILSSWCTIDFPLGIYTDLGGGTISIFFKKKSTAHSLYKKLPKIFNLANRQHI
jgi:hypothetical protein